MKTEEQIRKKIKEIDNMDLSKPRTESDYKLTLTSLLKWVIE